MAKQEKDIILKIDVDYSEATKAIAEYTERIQQQRKEQKVLADELKNNKLTQEEYRRRVAASDAAIKDYSTTIAAYRKEIQNNIKEEREQEGSINKLRAQLALNTVAYNKLSEAERNAAKGQAFQKSIKETSDQLKAAEQQIGDFRRSVGNYAGAFKEQSDRVRELTDTLIGLQQANRENTKEYADAKKELGELKAQLDEVRAVTKNAADDQRDLNALAQGVQSVVASYGAWIAVSKTLGVSNDDAIETINKLQQVQAVLNAITVVGNALKKESALMQAIVNGQQKAGILATNLETAAQSKNIVVKYAAIVAQKALNLVMSANPVLLLVTGVGLLVGALTLFSRTNKEAAAEQEKANKIYDQTVKQNEKYVESLKSRGRAEEEVLTESIRLQSQSLKQARDLFYNASLLYKKDSDEYAEAAQRVADAQQLIEDSSKDAAKLFEGLAGKVEQYNLRKGKSEAEYTREFIELTAKRRLDLLEEMFEAGLVTREYAEYRRAILDSLNIELEEFNKKQADIANKAWADQKKKAEEHAKDILSIERRLQDESLAIIEDETEKVRKIQEEGFKRELADFRRQYKDLSKYTKEEREKIAALEAAIFKRQQNEREKLIEVNSNKEIAEQLAHDTQAIQLRLDAVKKGTKEEFDIRMEQLQKQREAELEANDQLAEDKRQSVAAINAKYDALEADQQKARLKEAYRQEQELTRTAAENRLLQLYLDGQNQLQADLEIKQTELDALLKLDEANKAALYESEVQYQNAVLQKRKEVADASIAVDSGYAENLGKIANAFGALSDANTAMYEAFGENASAFGAFAKSLALFQILVSTAQALANATASAKGVTAIDYAIQVAAAIATVLTNIAQAKKILSSAKEPKSPKFSKGGNVTGPGSGTSDSITARLSNGESVITAAATSAYAPLLSAINQAGGGVPIASSGAAQINNQVVMELSPESIGALAEAVGNVNPVVSVQEINAVNGRVEAIEATI